MDFSIPPLTMQPIVENAVRYGALSREDGGSVEITTEETATAYRIIIKDDGIGFVPAAQADQNRSHVGIENVRSRLDALCGGTLEIQSVEQVGTTAVLTIPKEETTP